MRQVKSHYILILRQSDGLHQNIQKITLTGTPVAPATDRMFGFHKHGMIFQNLVHASSGVLDNYRVYMGLADPKTYLDKELVFESRSINDYQRMETTGTGSYTHAIRAVTFLEGAVYFGGSQDTGTGTDFSPLIGWSDPTTFEVTQAWTNDCAAAPYCQYTVDVLYIPQDTDYKHIFGLSRAYNLDWTFDTTQSKILMIVGKDHKVGGNLFCWRFSGQFI